jgi:hypothetical protein
MIQYKLRTYTITRNRVKYSSPYYATTLEHMIRAAKRIWSSARYAAVNYDAPNDPALTNTDKDLLTFLSLMSGKKGVCWPAIDFLCVGLSLNPSSNYRHVRRRLAKLEAMGYITRDARYQVCGSGRQMSNKITINYLSSVQVHPQRENPKSAPPININIYNLPFKEKLKEKESSPTAVWTYPEVKLVYRWKKRSGKGSGFEVMRSKSLQRGLARDIHRKNTSKWKYLLAENNNNPLIKPKPIVGKAMMPKNEDGLDDLFTIPTHKLPPPKLSTILVDKPVDSSPSEATPAKHVGNVSWADICIQMNRMNDQFQHWSTRLYMNGVRGHTIELCAETPYFRDTCQLRFCEDLLRACKKLNYAVKFVNIELRKK